MSNTAKPPTPDAPKEDKSLDEILLKIIDLELGPSVLAEALAQINNYIKEQMLSLIGEDVANIPMESKRPDGTQIVQVNPINVYKAELRSAINERFK